MSEDRPHIVFPGNDLNVPSLTAALVFPTYSAAHHYWKRAHDTLKSPHLIASITINRVIDPSVPVIDPSE